MAGVQSALCQPCLALVVIAFTFSCMTRLTLFHNSVAPSVLEYYSMHGCLALAGSALQVDMSPALDTETLATWLRWCCLLAGAAPDPAPGGGSAQPPGGG